MRHHQVTSTASYLFGFYVITYSRLIPLLPSLLRPMPPSCSLWWDNSSGRSWSGLDNSGSRCSDSGGGCSGASFLPGAQQIGRRRIDSGRRCNGTGGGATPSLTSVCETLALRLFQRSLPHAELSIKPDSPVQPCS